MKKYSKCIIECKLQAFQHNILHIIVSHDYLLEKNKLLETNECASCEKIENIEHIFLMFRNKTILERMFLIGGILFFEQYFFVKKDRVNFGVLNSDNLVLNYCIL